MQYVASEHFADRFRFSILSLDIYVNKQCFLITLIIRNLNAAGIMFPSSNILAVTKLFIYKILISDVWYWCISLMSSIQEFELVAINACKYYRWSCAVWRAASAKMCSVSLKATYPGSAGVSPQHSRTKTQRTRAFKSVVSERHSVVREVQL